MVIIGNKSGQLGNRLFVYAHVIANAIEYGYEVANPSFYDYSPYFATLKDDFFCCYPARKSFLKSNGFLQGAYFRLLTQLVGLASKVGVRLFGCDLMKVKANGHDGDDYDLSSPEFIARREAVRHLLVKGWAIRDFRALEKHAEEVRRYFAPAETHVANIARLMERARQGCDLLVGVHIRQGDYRTWLGGRHFYETKQYADLMRDYAARNPGMRVRFLVCSNAKQDESLFDGLDYLMGNNHQFEDMYSFARCDRLIGPPSTYTAWASFYGSVPLFFVKHPGEPVLEEGFLVYTG